MDVNSLPFRNLRIFLSRFKIGEETFIAEYKEWLNNSPEKTFNDFMWKYFEKTTIRIVDESTSKIKLYENMRDIYAQMVFFRIDTEKLNANDLLRQKHYYSLMAEKCSGLKTRVTIIGRSDCKKCKEINYSESLETEIKKRTLPFKNCPLLKSNYYFMCSCTYGFSIVRDKNGLPLRDT